MKKIKVQKWKEKVRGNGGIEERDTNTVKMLSVLLGNVDAMPKGMDTFRAMSRIGKAFDKAEKTGTLELEEADYSFLKKTIESEIPSQWGAVSEISKAVESFLEPEGN
jgi:hypothetical protein